MGKFVLYKIIQDKEALATVVLDEVEEGLLEFDCFEKSEEFENIKCTISGKLANDFYFLNEGCLVFSSKVEDLMAYPLELSGEVIKLDPVDEPKNPIFLLNILECQNILDYQNSEISVKKGQDVSDKVITKYAFKPNRINMPVSLFKLPDDSLNTIYCITGLTEDGFYELYHQHNLEGLKFEFIHEFTLKDKYSSNFELQ